MPELDDAALERRVRGVLQEHLGGLPLDLTVETLDRRREAKARRLGRGRSVTLLAAAALLLVGGALAAGSGILRLPTVVPPVPSPSVVAVATASPDATFRNPRESAAPSANPIPAAGPGDTWLPTGSMVTPHEGHAAVRLLDGRVLVMGDDLAADLYDPATGTWSATGTMLKPLDLFAAVLLHDGTVLVGSSTYDPTTGTWTATGPMAVGVGAPTAPTVLRDGKVLVTGSYRLAELYDPATRTWIAVERPNAGRWHAAATLLSDGKVLVAGGAVVDPEGEAGYRTVDSAEVYDPATGTWTAIADMPAPAGSAAVLLPDGKVLVGHSTYDQATGTWTALPVSVNYNSAALLSDGTVLLADNRRGRDPAPGCATADLYDPRTGSLTTVSGIPWCGVGSFTPLLDGTVLVAGGWDCQGDGEARECVANGRAALYVPAGVTLPALPAFPSPPPPVFPSPTPTQTLVATPVPTRLPPAAGPIPPNARSWTVTVENLSSEPAELFVANDMLQLVGSATPNVVPAGATMEVTFLFPVDGGLIYVNPRPGDGWLVSDHDIGIPGKILIGAEGGGGWLSP
jgi:Kelch motif protein